MNTTICSHVGNTTYKRPPKIIKVCWFGTFIMFTSYSPHLYHFSYIKHLPIHFKQTSITPSVLELYRTLSSCMYWQFYNRFGTNSLYGLDSQARYSILRDMQIQHENTIWCEIFICNPSFVKRRTKSGFPCR
jgi:hypothetical protein